jgi:CBS domain-containing protein
MAGKVIGVHDDEEASMHEETVRDAMTEGPTTIAASAAVVEAAKLMASQGVGSLPVVEEGTLVGMVTDRDLVLHVLAKNADPNEIVVSDVYSETPVVAEVDEPLDAALERMAREQVRRLPVVDRGRLVGIVAQADISRAASPADTGRMVEEISER